MRLTSLVLLFPVLALAGPTTPVAVLKDRVKLDGKTVQVRGVVADFKAKTSKKGNKYFTFDLVEGKKSVAVYGRGELPKAPRAGDKVLVSGRFRKEKKLGDKTFINEIELDVRDKNVLTVVK